MTTNQVTTTNDTWSLGLLDDFGAYLDSLGLAPSTRQVKERVVLRFARWSSFRGEQVLAADTATIEAWLAEHESMSSSTRTSYLAALRLFYEWLAVTGRYPGANPVSPLRRWPTAPSTPATIAEAAHDYRVAQERRGLAASTIAKRAAELRMLAVWLAPRHPFDATTADLEAWLDQRRMAPKARHSCTSHLRAFYGWARRAGHIDVDPSVELERPRFPQGVPRPIATDDLALALAEAEPRTRALLSLAAYAGLRCHEIGAVAREDVLDHLTPALLVVRRPKGNRQRMVPLHGELRAALARLPMPRAGYLFGDDAGRPMVGWKVSQIINTHLHERGITATAHQLRHWFGSSLYANTRDLRLVQETLGHASPTTTAVYTAFNPGNAVAAVAALRVTCELRTP